MKICIWCKYDKQEAGKIYKTTLIVLKDNNKCMKCHKEGISSTFMEEE